MIRYALVCDRHHEFESWFSNSADYDKQAKRGLVACPLCGSAKVEKALMTPRLSRSELESRQEPHGEPHGEPQQAARKGSRQESSAESSAEPRQLAPAPAEAAPVAMMSPQEQELRQKLRELRDHLVKNSENVGANFPEEARKMHYGETEHRSIYGVASPKEAEEMHEEGIAFSALPVLPDDRN
jgi:hypothetical protein